MSVKKITHTLSPDLRLWFLKPLLRASFIEFYWFLFARLLPIFLLMMKAVFFILWLLALISCLFVSCWDYLQTFLLGLFKIKISKTEIKMCPRGQGFNSDE